MSPEFEYLEPIARCGCSTSVNVEHIQEIPNFSKELWKVSCPSCLAFVVSYISEKEAIASWNTLVGRGLRVFSIKLLRYLSYNYTQDTKLKSLLSMVELELAKVFDPTVAPYIEERINKGIK